MKIAETLRQDLGLTQQDLARFLGSDRSSLARSEKGLRLLSALSSSRLATLHKIHRSEPVQKSAAIIQDPGIEQDLKNHAFECRYKANCLRNRLQKMETRYEQATRLKGLTENISGIHAKNKKQSSLDKKQLDWLEEFNALAMLRLQKNNMSEQIKLQLQIRALEAEAELYEQQVEGEKRKFG
jgi:transcriptional regulator with XRE-family HTH domain